LKPNFFGPMAEGEAPGDVQALLVSLERQEVKGGSPGPDAASSRSARPPAIGSGGVRQSAVARLEAKCRLPGEPPEAVTRLATAIEGQLFVAHGGVNDRYRTQLRVLLANLPNVLQDVYDGLITAPQLATCAAKDLQSKELSLQRAQLLRQQLEERRDAPDVEDLCDRCGRQRNWLEAKGWLLRDDKVVWEQDYHQEFCVCQDPGEPIASDANGPAPQPAPTPPPSPTTPIQHPPPLSPHPRSPPPEPEAKRQRTENGDGNTADSFADAAV